MRDRDLLHDEPGVLRKNRHEPVQPVEGGEIFQNRAPKDAQVAARVGKVRAQHQLPGDPSDAGGNEAEPIIGAPGPHATNHVRVSQQLEHPGKVGWVVLEIAVQGCDERGQAGLKAGPQSRALSGVAGMAEPAQARVVSARLHDPLPGVIGAAVVHQDELDPAPGLLEGPENALGQREDVQAFVPQRHDD